MVPLRWIVASTLFLWLASSASAQFQFIVNGTTVVDTNTGVINTTYDFGPGNAITVTVSATSANVGNGYTMTVNNISFQNGTTSDQTVVIRLRAIDVLANLVSGTVPNVIFTGLSSLNSSSLGGLPGTVANTASIQGTTGSLNTQGLFNQNFTFSAAGGSASGSFTVPYLGTNPYTVEDTLTVTVPQASGFTYSALLTVAVPEPTTIAMMGLAVVGAAVFGYRTFRHRREATEQLIEA